jgi:ATP-dependent Clp protease adaptor protein ClpS
MSDDVDVMDPDVVDKKKLQSKEPSFYKVILLNDHFTPMDFVVEVLQKYFEKTYEDAERIMKDVHEKGSGIAGLYTHDLAETKSQQANDYAKQKTYPFKTIIQEN